MSDMIMPKAVRKSAPKAAPEAPKAAPEAPKADAVVALSPAQKAAEVAVVKAAGAVVKSVRTVAVAIGAAFKAGVHAAYGLSLPEWTARTLTGGGIPKATAYYLRDIGTGYAVLGAERADLFPMEGLRTLVAKAKGDEDAIMAAADVAQGGDPKAAPTLKACRAAAGGPKGLSENEAIGRIIRATMSAAGNDPYVALDLLGKAMDRIEDDAKAADAREEAKAAK